MSNYPDDIHDYDGHQRSPFYKEEADPEFKTSQNYAEELANEMIYTPELLLASLVNDEPPKRLEDFAYKLACTAGDGNRQVLRAAMICFRFGFEEECTRYARNAKAMQDLQEVVKIIPPRMIDDEQSDEIYAGEIMIAAFVKNIRQLTSKQLSALKDVALCLAGYKFT